ncbi:hypothetical protein MIZ01_1069 [Sideroxyarcus emersonii]|uniref:Uncharacterized protein n=1 Tax=Sideroxyarcus emersonii TaxID=2764705 RepID=A0AAN1X9B0_9PROT|nr:hypothetical protein [Sideroxyarcus emersonii]BCK87297.1 hypothetical protein MIZ01_1069 [Sideroxyarcus emersonii]
MTYHDSNDTEKEDAAFSVALGWLAALATVIASIAGVVSLA